MDYEKALNFACREITERTGSCPIDYYDVDIRDCDSECKLGIYPECWKLYFLKISERWKT